jgi:hypothetical protein
LYRCLIYDGAFDKTLLEFNGTLLKCNFGRIDGSTEKEKQIMLKSDCISGQNDTQHNDTQHNDTQHNDTQHNDTQHNDTQHIGIISDIQPNAT